MEWIEGKITTAPEAVEAVGEMLSQAGISGFQIEDNEEMKKFLRDNPLNWDYVDDCLLNEQASPPVVKFYVPANACGREILLQVNNQLKRLKENDYGLEMGQLALTLDNVDDSGWLENWKKYYKPFQIGEKIIIRPTWEEYDNKDRKLVFTINPGHVFGTGLHQSTRICVEELEKLIKPGQNVLDLGCGSGILGIISMMLGAKNATLVDIDPAAAETAYENALLNGISLENFKVFTGNAATDEKIFRLLTENDNPGNCTAIKENKYDIVISNIVADVIIKLAPVAARLISPGGIYLSSGIIEERLGDVLSALEQNGFEIISVKTAEGWVGVTCVFL